MKTKSPILLLFILYSLTTVYGQYAVYEFKGNLNSLISKKKNEIPTVFEVIKGKISVKKKTPRKKVENPIYKNIDLELKELLKDSIQLVEDNRKKIDTYNTINSAKNLINQFIKSTKPYEIKKEKLIKAQLLADNNNLDVLIYADTKINAKNKSKFFVLKLNSLDLKVHLKKIVWKIESKNKKPDIKTPSSPEKASELRKKLKTVNPYKYINGPSKLRDMSTLALGNEIKSPENIINGTFNNLGEYYVILKKINNQTFEQLISIDKVKSMDSKKLNFVFDITATLIQKTDNNKLYLVASGFIDEYSLTKLSQQKKFKDKIKLPFKIYSTVNDRLIDSIILSHNINRLSMK